MPLQDHLHAIDELYQAEVGARRDAEANATRFAQELSEANAKVLELQAEIEELTKPEPEPTPEPEPEPEPTPEPIPEPEPVPEPEPDSGFLLRETFQAPLDPKKWIFLCNDPAKNFVWTEPGYLDVVFVAGKTTGTAIDSESGKILRSEIELRKLGQTTGGTPEGLPVGREYVLVTDVKIPEDYDPKISNNPNERRHWSQLWEHKDFSPWSLEMIRPSVAPYDGKTDYLRVIVAGQKYWLDPVQAGKRYRVRIQVLLHKTAGRMLVNVNGKDFPPYSGPTCWGAAAQLVPHWGLYLPGAKDDPVGGRTALRYHEISIKPI